LNPTQWIKENPVSESFKREVIEVIEEQFDRLEKF
jgi:hypothetical protein